MSIRFEKIWVQQCKATKGIKRRFGAKSALDYLIRVKPIGGPSPHVNCHASWRRCGVSSTSTRSLAMLRA
jgi:hypothetical protein